MHSYTLMFCMLDAHKDWLMRVGNIVTDAQYEESKRIALQQFEHYKKMDEKERVSRGASPFHGDFIAERESLAEQVEGIPADSPLYAFAKKAVDALDGNAGWSYDRKVRALRFLATRAEKYGQGEVASAPVEAHERRAYYDRDGEGRGLADDDAALPVVLQMGKVGKDCFNMDYTFPFSMLQAFAVCLARFDTGVPLATTR